MLKYSPSQRVSLCIIKDQTNAIEQLEDQEKGANDKDKDEIRRQIAIIQQKTQEEIDSIRTNQEKDIRNLLKSQGLQIAN